MLVHRKPPPRPRHPCRSGLTTSWGAAPNHSQRVTRAGPSPVAQRAKEHQAADHNGSRTYAGDPEAVATNTAASHGVVWHPTGDIARVDDEGRRWLRGRRGQALSHGTQTLYPLPLEAALGERTQR
jgi:acyl-coenzyme A synthetase/AMP-(fatty) acid ligase